MGKTKAAIKWSPSLDKQKSSFDWMIGTIELFPPFLQKERPEFPGEPVKPSKKPVFVAPETTDHITVCCKHGFLQSADNRSVVCKHVCQTSDPTCEELRKLIRKPVSHREITEASEFRDEEDYEYFEVEGDEEVEKDGEKESLFPWLEPCEDVPPFEQPEEVPPDTVDPYMSHKLYIPYNQMPRPRHFHRSEEDPAYTVTRLPRRPRSPVRKSVRGTFDLRAAREQWERKRDGTESTRVLEESKKRISQSLKELTEREVDGAISSVALRAVYQQVTLTLMDAKIDMDIHTFVNVAVIWALSELQLFNRDTPSDERLQRSGLTTSRLPQDFMYCDYARRNILGMTGNGGMRKVLLGVYRPPFSHNIDTTLHHRPPWPYVSPSHERGHTKFYPNIRERIAEQISKTTIADQTSIYVSDVRCAHVRNVTDESDVAYRRTSKYHAKRSSVPTTTHNLLLQLVSFT